MNDFGKWLAQQRNLRHWTQDDLATELRMHPRNVTKWESGRGIPSRNTLRRIAFIFKIDEAELLNAARGGTELPDAPAPTLGLKLPMHVQTEIVRQAERAKMEPATWVERVLRAADNAAQSLMEVFNPIDYRSRFSEPDPDYPDLDKQELQKQIIRLRDEAEKQGVAWPTGKQIDSKGKDIFAEIRRAAPSLEYSDVRQLRLELRRLARTKPSDRIANVSRKRAGVSR